MVGIRDIANKAEVSISTVSYALNGSPRVSEATRKRILDIANEMNYIPNMAGQNLRRQNTNIIAVYLSSYQGTFYSELLESMNKQANELGLELIVCSGQRSHLFLPQKMIDGILVLDMTYSNEELIKYANMGYPIVLLDRELNHDKIRSVLLNNKSGTREAMYSLIDKKVTKIFVISGPANNHDSAERTKAAIDVANKYSIDYEIIEGNFNEKSGYEAAERMTIGKSECVGIFALNDEMALGAFNYIKEDSNISINDVYIHGFDKIQVTQYLNPRIQSVSYSKEDWGQIAVETLDKLIKGTPVENHIIPTYFEN
ncbi:LacI family transcriptional regulator [Alkalibacterium putridalgicola]|uniref:LacI family transcriptional regulator n=1 Tax=Alkalibacterium putridalgicola TaxID=426703 RepID=A0A1H7QIG5_9LACT|nr:LacI family DNA-binding transcriptional regulator [Alkalibacterium putridalgicola]GEK88456.1 LacI family transcriptional regulator [Alkalibacterium putridalgicola]SEL47742.1 LacI family transcriptional regulator [Alkalibacterium putridalgicola]